MDDDRSARQIARQERRDAGERAAKLAATLMKLSGTALGRLALDEELRDEVDRARAITSQVARRRAERTLAGALRRLDDDQIAAIEKAISKPTEDTAVFHEAERWRTRLLEDDAALAELGDEPELPPLIAKARAERDTGKPPGAGRALFRRVLAVLKARHG